VDVVTDDVSILDDMLELELELELALALPVELVLLMTGALLLDNAELLNAEVEEPVAEEFDAAT
jgi:hypothetical protein